MKHKLLFLAVCLMSFGCSEEDKKVTNLAIEQKKKDVLAREQARIEADKSLANMEAMMEQVKKDEAAMEKRLEKDKKSASQKEGN